MTLPEDAKGGQNSPARIVVSKSIEADVLNHPSGHFTPEDVIVVHCSPQSVFRVRPATRCSSTLSGIILSLEIGIAKLNGSQDIPHQFSALHFPQLANFWQLALGILTCVYGISTQKPPHTPFLATKGGFCVSNGSQWKGYWQVEAMMDTPDFGIPRQGSR